MRLFVTVLALLALAAPQAAQANDSRGHATKLAQRDSLIHGIGGDERYVFVTEPGLGISTAGPRVVVLDRFTGREVAVLPPPPGGFKLPFTLRVPSSGHLVVLDSGGFPPVGPPIVYDYRYRSDRRGFRAELVRSVNDFAGKPLAFAEDVEVLPNGEYVVSESVIGGLWLVGRDGTVRPGLVPDDPSAPLPRLGGCALARGFVGGLPFAGAGDFAPGAGSLAVRGGDLYFSSTCQGGVQRLPIRTLLDSSRPAAQRAAEIVNISPRPAHHALESLKGITFNRWDPWDPWIYAGDPFRLQLIRVHSRTGERQVLSTDRRLFDFTVSTAFLPPVYRGKPNPLVTASDQEYRWATLNVALERDRFCPPFVVAEYWPAQGRGDHGRDRDEGHNRDRDRDCARGR